ncbi:MAG: hypothetical protein ACTSUE_03950 [Promethearchaeota archaeon]
MPDCDGEEGSRIIKLICECNDAFLDGKEIPDDPYWSFYKENIGRLEAIAKMQDLVKNGKWKGQGFKIFSTRIAPNSHVRILPTFGRPNLLGPKFPSFIRNLKRLRSLYLYSYSIREIPYWIGELKELREVNLYNTSIAKLPTTILNLSLKFKGFFISRHSWDVD